MVHFRLWVIGCVLAVISSTRVSLSAPPFTFHDVAQERGITNYAMGAPGQGGGLIAADYDDDGDVDLFAPTAFGMPDCLYQNQGDGTFLEIAASLGVASTANSRAALWFDYDGDGDLDLVVARDGYLDEAHLPADTLQLYRYDADVPIYINVTMEAGLTGDLLRGVATHIGGLCAGDISNNGYLDLLLTEWKGENYLFVNNGAGVFLERGVPAHISNGHNDPAEWAWQPVMFDVNEDGRLDVFICVDFNPNKLFINNGFNPFDIITFTDIAVDAGVHSAWNEMGVTLADYDGDGRIDMYVTNIDSIRKGVQRYNVMYRNVSVGSTITFIENAIELGVQHGYWGWGATFFDGDRDMFVDLAETNGNVNNPLWMSQPSIFFRNNGTTFDNITTEIGFDQPNVGSTLLVFDADRDGDLELAQNCAFGCSIRLLDNVPVASVGNHSIVIKPRMDGSNHFAIGATVKLVAGGRTQVRVISAGTSFLGQEPAEAFFGLGSNVMVDEVTIKWPSGGGQTTVNNIPGDQVRTINHFACPGDIEQFGVVDVFDLFALLSAWGSDGSTNPRVDIDSNGVVDVFDLFLLLGNWGQCN